MFDQRLSRRNFIGTAAAATAGAMLARSAFAADAAPERKDATLRWGIIGTGNRGANTHVQLLKDAPESKLVALCDVSPDRLKDAVDKAGHPVEQYDDYQKLLANPDVNAVVIATPNLLHLEMLQAALQAGKHVLCEKPAGANPADAVAMLQAADNAKTVLMFGMQYRHVPRHKKIQELIDSGRIGKPKYLIQNCSRGDWNLSPNIWQYSDPKVNGGKPGNWRFSYAATGGTLNEFSCHYFDMLNGLVGQPHPERISCDGGIAVYHNGRNTWDYATVTMKYAGDITAVHTLSLFGPNKNDLTVMGTEGNLITDGEKITIATAKRGTKNSGNKPEEVMPDPAPKGFDRTTGALYVDFLNCVKTGKKPDAGIDRALAASRTCWVSELASQRRAEVKWDDLGSTVAKNA